VKFRLSGLLERAQNHRKSDCKNGGDDNRGKKAAHEVIPPDAVSVVRRQIICDYYLHSQYHTEVPEPSRWSRVRSTSSRQASAGTCRFFLGVDNLDDDQQILREAYANVTIRFIGGFPPQRRFGGGRLMAFSPRSN
jgi:hypothetical protein